MPEFAPFQLDDERKPGSIRYWGRTNQQRTLAPGTSGQVVAYDSNGIPTATTLAASNISDFNEAAQDAVGNALVDGTTIDFTYNDGANTITAEVVAGSIGDTQIANFTRSIELKHFVLNTGTPVESVQGANLRYSAWAFDAASLEGITCGTFQVPRDWATGSITVVLHWTNLGAGSGDVVWRVIMKEVNDTGDLNATAGETDTSQAITAPAQNIHKISTHSISFTPSAAGAHVRLVVARSGADGSDTLGNDAGLLKVQLTYTAVR